MKKLTLFELGRIDNVQYKVESTDQIIVVLDNIRSAHNVGAFFRTCDGFGIKQLMLCGITATPPHADIHKSAIGATESVDWHYFDTSKECAQMLIQKGYKLIGIEQTDQSVMLHEDNETFNQPIAIIFGNEVNGLSDDLLPLLDKCVEIPQFGTKHSFNVSICGGIVLWEYVKQLRFG